MVDSRGPDHPGVAWVSLRLRVLRRASALAATLVLLTACGGDGSLGEETPRDAAVWVSADGRSWQRVEDEALTGPGEQQMTAVTQVGSSLLGAGFEKKNGATDAAVWMSEDGHAWRRVLDDDLGGPEDQLIWDVAPAGPGVIAVGSSGSDAAIWVSEDGLDWTRIHSDSLDGRGNQLARAIVEGPRGIFVGGVDYLDAGLWVSEDGFDWSRVDHHLLQDVDDQIIGGLLLDQNGVIAVGGDAQNGAVWLISGDEIRRLSGDEVFGGNGNQVLNSAIRVDGRTVAAGSSFSYDTIDLLGGGTSGAHDPFVIASENGSRWQAESQNLFREVGDQIIYSLASRGSQVVAVGYEYAARGSVGQNIAGFGSGFDVNAVAWLSETAGRWEKISSDAFGGDGWQDMFDLVVMPDGTFVAVGGDDLGSGP